MKRPAIKIATLAVFGLVAMAATSAKAQNFNQIVGHGNSVVNGGGGGFGPSRNFNSITGNGNTVINGGSRSPWSTPSYSTPVTYHRPAFVSTPHVMPQPHFQPVRYHRPTTGNYNVIRGNGNRVVNGGGGGLIRSTLGTVLQNGVNVNVNSVRGNQNSIVNGSPSRGGLNLNINSVRGNGNSIFNR